MSNKNILFVGFYDDFARFYHGIAKEMDCNCYYVFQNLSGYFYSLSRNFGNTYLFFLPIIFFWRHLSGKHPTINNVQLMYILEYGGSYSKFRMFVARILYLYWLEKIAYLEIDSIIIAGDSRPISRIFKLVGERLGCKLSFFEQGPNNTTILDSSGVNANCSFRAPNSKCYQYSGEYKIHTEEKYKRNPIYRLCDYCFDFFFLSLFLQVFAEKNIQSLVRATYTKTLTKKIDFELYDYSKKYILLILQVPEDANMVLHSPYFKSFYKLLIEVSNAIPSDFNLLIREHPLHKFGYEKEMYDFIKSHPNVFLDSEFMLEEQISKSSLVVVNNSTVGFEVLFLKKRLMVLGDSYYDQYDYLTKLKDLNHIQNDLKRALVAEIDISRAESYVAWSFSKNFIQGHYRAKDISMLCQTLAKRL
jgi:capsular polysaccharide export protein